jgi:hypothetical protein
VIDRSIALVVGEITLERNIMKVILNTIAILAMTLVLAACQDDPKPTGMGPGSDKMEGMGMMKGMEGCGKNMGAMMDTDKDGKVSRDEFTKHHDEMFAQMDTNKDGTLDQSEMGHMGKMMESHCAGMPMK